MATTALGRVLAGDPRAAIGMTDAALAHAGGAATPRARAFSWMVAARAGVYRDLRRPEPALRWHTHTGRPERYPRAAGLNYTVAASAHLHAGRLEEALAVGHHALDLLHGVASARAGDYLRVVLTQLGPWRREPPTRAFTHRATRYLTT